MKERNPWGWGWKMTEKDIPQLEPTKEMLKTVFPPPKFHIQPPDMEAIAKALPKPRFPSPPLHSTSDGLTRLTHSLGKSFRDLARGVLGKYDNVVDWVVYPKDEEDLHQLYKFTLEQHHEGNAIHLIPFGGGTSVVGGIEPLNQPSISVDMSKFVQCQVNLQDMAATVGAGLTGPQLLTKLKQVDKSLTLRHFPQSFEFSTVGGWLATRSGGHYATSKTYIDDFVVDMTIVTSKGTLKTNGYPASGAGPVPDKIFLGSEGIFGFITSCTLRIQREPKYKAGTQVIFQDWRQGIEASRRLSQAGLNPTQCRLMEGREAISYGIIDSFVGGVLVLGFESSEVDVKGQFEQALEICKECGGTWSKVAKGDTFRNNFVLAPYLRDFMILDGYIMETFETCCLWSNFERLDKAVRKAIADTGRPSMVTVRFTHLYPDGPAPYYTVTSMTDSPENLLSDWDDMKMRINTAIITNGGTITHHHAVGKDHAPWFVQERNDLWISMLRQTKGYLDPLNVMNPGTLLPVKIAKL